MARNRFVAYSSDLVIIKPGKVEPEDDKNKEAKKPASTEKEKDK